jgi:ubiquinone/menaquinone biosynthesis C-methylase UbiE
LSGIKNKTHWYDGYFYAKYLDPWTKELREMISQYIEDNSSVIDIGCGTGALAFEIAEKCKSVVGVELSLKMLRHAYEQKQKGDFSHVEFVHADGSRLTEMVKGKFDYATTSFVLHEMSQKERLKAVEEMKKIAQKVIIADFVAPQPKNFWGFLNTFSEALGGPGHFKGYWSFLTSGGIEMLLNKYGMKIEDETVDKTRTFKVVKAYQ